MEETVAAAIAFAPAQIAVETEVEETEELTTQVKEAITSVIDQIQDLDSISVFVDPAISDIMN